MQQTINEIAQLKCWFNTETLGIQLLIVVLITHVCCQKPNMKTVVGFVFINYIPL